MTQTDFVPTVHTIKQWDTLPAIDEILKDGNDNPINLAGISGVYLHVSTSHHREVKIHRLAEIFDPTQVTNVGRVIFRFDTNGAMDETAISGVFPREWRIDWGLGQDQRVPNNGDDILHVYSAVAEDDA